MTNGRSEGKNTPQGACEVNLWPIPSSYSNGNSVLTIDPSNFSIIFSPPLKSSTLSPILNRITSRYLSLLKTTPTSSITFHQRKNWSENIEENSKKKDDEKEFKSIIEEKRLEVLIIKYEEGSLEGSLTSLWPNESYSLSVPFSSNATLFIYSIPSLIWGFETFSQLAIYNNHSLSSRCEGYKEGRIIPQVPWEINDTPRFKWRGLLVDTSRHFLPISTLQTIIDGLSYNKLNRLHLHLTDAQSFPVLFDPPLDILAKNGAYSPFQLYSESDFRQLQDYALERGVKIIPEVDSPGHSYSWGYSFPNLVVCPNIQANWNLYCNEPPCGQLDPTNPLTFKLVSSIFTEISRFFNSSSPFLHLGYDEVNFECWNSVPHIREFMLTHNLSNSSLLQYYLTSQTSSLPSFSIPIFWDEVWQQNLSLPSNSIIQVWTSLLTYHQILRHSSHPVILSNYDAWYLDCGFGSWVSIDQSWCKYNNWQTIYLNDPFVGLDDLTDDELDRAYGGEVCIWGEQNDANNILPNIFPRVCAAAERLWSPRHVVDTITALPRLLSQRDRLLSRNIPSSPLQPLWCEYNPHNCDLPHSNIT